MCGASQQTVDYPRVYVCNRCLRPLANRLCQETLRTDLAPGIDEYYFVSKAREYAELLIGPGDGSLILRREPTSTREAHGYI